MDTSTSLGVNLVYDSNFGCSHIADVIAGSAISKHVNANKILNKFLLEVNGARLRTVDDVERELKNHSHLAMTLMGVTLLIRDADNNRKIPDDLDFSPLDDGIMRLVWSITAPDFDTTGIPNIALVKMMSETLDNAYIHSLLTPKGLHVFVASITDSIDQCPHHWGEVLKSCHKKEWKEALFKHLNSNDSYGTFGPPQ